MFKIGLGQDSLKSKCEQEIYMVNTMPVQVLAGVDYTGSRPCIVHCIKTSHNLDCCKQVRIKIFNVKNQWVKIFSNVTCSIGKYFCSINFSPQNFPGPYENLVGQKWTELIRTAAINSLFDTLYQRLRENLSRSWPYDVSSHSMCSGVLSSNTYLIAGQACWLLNVKENKKNWADNTKLCRGGIVGERVQKEYFGCESRKSWDYLEKSVRWKDMPVKRSKRKFKEKTTCLRYLRTLN